MSNYRALAFNPKMGRVENADYVDNYFGPHEYGVKFDDGQILRPHECDFNAAGVALAAAMADLAKLSDPAAVHLNMLRGTIAKPSWEAIKHVYAAESEAERAHVEAQNTVIKAALDWWSNKRPVRWSNADHAEHPTVNCHGSNSEKRLAEAISVFVLGQQDQQHGKSAAHTTDNRTSE